MFEIVHHAFGDKRCFYCGNVRPAVHFGYNSACIHKAFKFQRPPGHKTIPVQSFWSCLLWVDFCAFEGIDDE